MEDWEQCFSADFAFDVDQVGTQHGIRFAGEKKQTGDLNWTLKYTQMIKIGHCHDLQNYQPNTWNKHRANFYIMLH